MKISMPVMTAYIILSIIIFSIGLILVKSFEGYYVSLVLMFIWVYATGTLIIMKSISLIKTKKVDLIMYGIILLAIGPALIIFGHRVVNMILWFLSGYFDYHDVIQFMVKFGGFSAVILITPLYNLMHGGIMKIPILVWIAYIVLTIIVLSNFLPTFFIVQLIIVLIFYDNFIGIFNQLLIWVYATGILITMKSMSIISTKKVDQKISGSIFLAIGLALIIFGNRIVTIVYTFLME